MKNIFALSAFCLLITLVFSSCGSHLTITKRHFNNGYYIDFDNGKGITKNSKASVTETNVKSDVITIEVSEKENETGVNTVKTFASHVDTSDKITPEPSQNVIVKNSSLQPDLSVTPQAKLMSNIKHLSPKIGVKKQLSNLHSEEGLSLFWIVILVILILWAIGILTGGFGLGALINLLLLVVLILLILWLLRVL